MHSLRTRLLVAFVLLTVGVLAVAGGATYLLTRWTARAEATDELRTKALDVVTDSTALRRVLTDETGGTAAQSFVRGIAGVLDIADAHIVFLTLDGRILDGDETGRVVFSAPAVRTAFSLPPVFAGHEPLLRPADLQAGRLVSGSIGDTVFVARPVEQLGGRRFPQRTQPVLVLTNHLDTNVVGRAGPFFLLAAGATLLVAAGVAFWLARRMTRPLRDMQSTAVRIAGGDLAARAPVAGGEGDELASLASTLNTMAAQLEQARGAERAFLLSISHDLRTPLTSIRGYAEALADGTLDADDPDARTRAASVITAEAGRLERLVRDLLDLSRLDAREFSLHPQRCDAAEVVAGAADAFVPAARDMGVALTVHRDGPVDADVDADRLAQVVANLVENALKYATARVDVHVETVGTSMQIDVVDDGPGVPDEELGRVFERLYTGRGAPGRAVGTGLGLAIVRELTRAMGGDAHAERATDDGGAKFVVRIPVRR